MRSFAFPRLCEQVGRGSEDAKLRFASLAHANRLVEAQRTRSCASLLWLMRTGRSQLRGREAALRFSGSCEQVGLSSEDAKLRFASLAHANRSVSAPRT